MLVHDLIEHVHRKQRRKTGEKYTSHLYAVRNILESHGIQEEHILNAALLHDTIEDTYLSKEYIAWKFGSKTADIVWTVSKSPFWQTSYCKIKSSIDQLELSCENYPEAILIKIADRIHNIQTIQGFRLSKQSRYLWETRELLAPFFQEIAKSYSFGIKHNCLESLLAKLNLELTIAEISLSFRQFLPCLSK